MERSNYFIKNAFIAFTLLLVLATLFFSKVLAASEESLFKAIPAPQSYAVTSKVENVLRSRYVEINLEKLLSGQPSGFALNPFPEQSYHTTHIKSFTNNSGSLTWIGHLKEQPNASVIFIIKDQSIFGTFKIPEQGLYQIRPLTNSQHLIEEILPTPWSNFDTDIRIPPSAPLARVTSESTTPASSRDDGSIIDVYVAYDQDDTGDKVTQEDAENYAELFVAYTNQAYENSDINQRIWLVGVGGFNYNDNNHFSLSEDLDAATNGSIPSLHQIRNETHADLVVFLTPFGGACNGVAWLQTTNNQISAEKYGYSAMTACPYGASVFAHELGHNMGSRHDWFVDSGITPSSIAHGYVDTVNQFATIMSYPDRCTALGLSCENIPYFSNPKVLFNGAPTGVSMGTSTNCSQGDASPDINCDADNKSNFDSKALITSQFRDSWVTWTGASDQNWFNPTNWSVNLGSLESSTISHRVPRSYDNVMIPSGLLKYPSIAGSANARELIIDNGAQLHMQEGTLSIGLKWLDEGGFSSSGGTVEFNGPLNLSLSSQSSFNHIQIGNGINSTLVTLESDLDIRGDILIHEKSTLKGGANNIKVAGRWQELSTQGFNPETSTVEFFGNNLAISKIENQNDFSENFSNADNQTGYSTAYLPTNWTRSNPSPWYAGNQDSSGRAVAASSADGWLFSPQIDLATKTNYSLSLDFQQDAGDGTLNVYLGNKAQPESMKRLLGTLTESGSANLKFNIEESDTLYIGFYHVRGSEYTWSYIDNIQLNSSQGLSFYNLHIMSGSRTINQQTNVDNSLFIDTGSTLLLGNYNITTEGSVTNYGTVQQSKNVSDDSNIAIGRITNSSGSTTKYQGVEIFSRAQLGQTDVEITHHSSCESSNLYQCFRINPSSPTRAKIKFYYHHPSTVTPSIYRMSESGSWVSETPHDSGTTEGFSWIKSDTISSYGYFSVAEGDIDSKDNASLIPYYRLYHKGLKNHFYTQDLQEYNHLATVEWIQEGVGYYIYDQPIIINGEQAKAWYRLYNRDLRTHLWSLSEQEYNTLGSLGWLQEGIAGYFFENKVEKSRPLYRLYNPDIKKHHWTMDSNEHNVLTSKGWNSEGIAGYVFSSPE